VSEYQTLTYVVDERHVATITLDRPDKLNSFNKAMCDEFSALWQEIRLDDAVHVVLLQANGDRAFSAGLDVNDGLPPSWLPKNIWSQEDTGFQLSPKMNRVWKPLICAVHGIAAGGAFYWLNEADIILCSDDAQFFDPHVSYGIVAAHEPIGLARRIPLGEVMRMALVGLDERVSAKRALEIGLVTEVVPRDQLHARAYELAASIAAKPPAAVQGTVKAIWESLDSPRTAATVTATPYWQLGNPIGIAQLDPDRPRPAWKLR